MPIRLLILALLALPGLPAGAVSGAPTVRIKDIASVSGTTGHKLIGYGLVVGLNATGDSSGSLITAQAMANLLEAFDIKIPPADMTMANVAAIVATADLPASARAGDRVDVTIASIGDATSLAGGILLPTPMRGDSGDVEALAQGAVSIGGYSAAGGGQSAQRNHPLTARLVDGVTVARDVPSTLPSDTICFTLRQPDFTTARRIAQAINESLATPAAHPLAAESVEVTVPPDQRADVVAFIAGLETLPVTGDTAARVVVNERTGTVIIGGDVRLMPVAIAHGSLTITIARRLEVSQPPPFSGGGAIIAPLAPGAAPPEAPVTGPLTTEAPAEPAAAPPPGPAGGPRTVVTPRTDLAVNEEPASLIEVQPPTCLRDLVEALNALGVKPRDLIAILQALKAAGALQAELVLM